MIGQVIDPFAEEGDLDFRRAGVLIVQAVRGQRACFFGLSQSAVPPFDLGPAAVGNSDSRAESESVYQDGPAEPS
jgi:hypothetical protein